VAGAMSERRGYAIRPATLSDVDTLVDLRLIMFEAMGFDDDIQLERVAVACRSYLEQHLPTDQFRAWVAEAETGTIASIGLVLHSVPPSPRNLVGLEAYIMNLVTLPAWRRRGIARALLSHVLGIVREEGVPVTSLHTSAEGRRLYESLGFAILEDGPEMVLRAPS